MPLYFAKKRPVVERDGTLIMRDDERMKLKPGEKVEDRLVRFRTLGCYPLTGAIESDADTLEGIVTEMFTARTSRAPGPADRQRRESLDGEEEEGGLFLMNAPMPISRNSSPRRKRNPCCAFSPAAASMTASPP